jgi:tRNA A37 threonylcarbamoyladenosine synthetase subunit TsaC/SUA5/YrdC
MVMDDRTFKPAGLTIAAIVAGLSPAALAQAPHAVKQAQAAKEREARETLIASAAKFKAAEPFAARKARETNVPLGQPGLFED